jgi:hypothetical protein
MAATCSSCTMQSRDLICMQLALDQQAAPRLSQGSKQHTLIPEQAACPSRQNVIV